MLTTKTCLNPLQKFGNLQWASEFFHIHFALHVWGDGRIPVLWYSCLLDRFCHKFHKAQQTNQPISRFPWYHVQNLRCNKSVIFWKFSDSVLLIYFCNNTWVLQVRFFCAILNLEESFPWIRSYCKYLGKFQAKTTEIAPVSGSCAFAESIKMLFMTNIQRSTQINAYFNSALKSWIY